MSPYYKVKAKGGKSNFSTIKRENVGFHFASIKTAASIITRIEICEKKMTNHRFHTFFKDPVCEIVHM